jgi:hypothetical protein
MVLDFFGVEDRILLFDKTGFFTKSDMKNRKFYPAASQLLIWLAIEREKKIAAEFREVGEG